MKLVGSFIWIATVAALVSAARGGVNAATGATPLPTSLTITTDTLRATGAYTFTPSPPGPQTSFTITTDRLSATGAYTFTPPPPGPQTSFTIITDKLSATGTYR